MKYMFIMKNYIIYIIKSPIRNDLFKKFKIGN